ncbi:MAG: DNA cytosine methyltransferase [Clostridia bacterium]|nr:DNA cytosine methyltransferase [Clostridia bacterium]
MSDRLTLGSLFSGSGTFELGGMLAGIEPVWNSEIEPFPIMVTRRRLPQVKHYGDVSALDGAKLEPVDVITFGSPCQDMSVAGRRAGLDGARSGLFHQAIRIIREMREATHGEKPRFIVWENVPGAFSSNHGQDFKAVLDEVIGIKEPGAAVPAPDKGRWRHADLFLGDGWSVAYRVLDAQYWGVAQRRRRVFLVADFGGERAGHILFERQSLPGNPGQGKAPGAGAAGDPAAGAGETGCWCLNPQASSGITVTNDITATLVAQDHGNHPAVLAAGFNTGDSATARSVGYADEVSPTIRAGAVPAAMLLEQLPFNIGAYNSLAWLSDNPRAGIYRADTVRTLDQSGGNPTAQQGGIAIVEAYAVTVNSFIQVEKGKTPALMARDYKDPIAIADPVAYRVRRLMPLECARLQGFPDWWCADLCTDSPDESEIDFWAGVFEQHRRLVTHAGKPRTRRQIVKWLRHPHTDGAEYKLWGNGCALPCVYFVMAGIAKVNGERL